MSGATISPRILVIDDNYMSVESLRGMLQGAGMQIVGPALSLAGALELGAAPGRIDAAIVDLDLHGEASLPAIDVLLERGVPVMLLTGYDVSVLPARYRQLPHCQKPIMASLVLQQVARLIDRRDGATA